MFDSRIDEEGSEPLPCYRRIEYFDDKDFSELPTCTPLDNKPESVQCRICPFDFWDIISQQQRQDQQIYKNDSPTNKIPIEIQQQQAQLSREVIEEISRVANKEPEACPAHKEDQQVIIDPELLLGSFRHVFYSLGKATNIAKYLVRVFFNNMSELDRLIPETTDRRPHLNWLEHHRRKLDKHSPTMFHMNELFLCSRTPKQARRSQIHRCYIISKLAESRKEIVLNNSMIPLENKSHYMYWCKVFEWKLGWLSQHGPKNRDNREI